MFVISNKTTKTKTRKRKFLKLKIVCTATIASPTFYQWLNNFLYCTTNKILIFFYLYHRPFHKYTYIRKYIHTYVQTYWRIQKSNRLYAYRDTSIHTQNVHRIVYNGMLQHIDIVTFVMPGQHTFIHSHTNIHNWMNEWMNEWMNDQKPY